MKNVPAVKKIHMPQEDAFTAHDCNKVETLLDFLWQRLHRDFMFPFY